jgi:hypothetical protein
MVKRAEPLYEISVGDVEIISYQFVEHLDAGELLTGTPTFVEQTTSNLTFGTASRNGTAYTDKAGVSVAANQAVQCSVTTSTAGTYTIRITTTTDATVARTFIRDIVIDIV